VDSRGRDSRLPRDRRSRDARQPRGGRRSILDRHRTRRRRDAPGFGTGAGTMNDVAPGNGITTAPLLAMRGMVKSFPGVQALRGVDLTLHAGEVVALVGENGAGKSTLMKLLGGAHRPDAGTIAVEGRVIAFQSPAEARQAGVAVIYQDFNLVPGLTAW